MSNSRRRQIIKSIQVGAEICEAGDLKEVNDFYLIPKKTL